MDSGSNTSNLYKPCLTPAPYEQDVKAAKGDCGGSIKLYSVVSIRIKSGMWQVPGHMSASVLIVLNMFVWVGGVEKGIILDNQTCGRLRPMMCEQMPCGVRCCLACHRQRWGCRPRTWPPHLQAPTQQHIPPLTNIPWLHHASLSKSTIHICCRSSIKVADQLYLFY